MRLRKKSPHYWDYSTALHPVELYAIKLSETDQQIVDWVAEQIEDAQEFVEETVDNVRNMARDAMKALTSEKGLRDRAGRMGDGSEVNYIWKVKSPIKTTVNSTRDSTISTYPVVDFKILGVGFEQTKEVRSPIRGD